MQPLATHQGGTGGELPGLTRLVITPGFVGTIAAGSFALALVLNGTCKRLERARTIFLAGLAIVGATTVVAVYVGMQLPIRALADPIH